MLKKNAHILLIAGTGRNSGKTNLACRILERFSGELGILALKISPHLHREPQELLALIEKPSYILYKETGYNPKKDSARMLAAGAIKSFYMEVRENDLPAAMEEFLQLISIPVPLIIESPALIRYLTPGLFIIVDNPGTLNKKKDILPMINTADAYIKDGSEIPETLLDNLRYGDAGWWLRPRDH